jgi:uncharacterized lipoprotein YddW (UPF0748 family)
MLCPGFVLPRRRVLLFEELSFTLRAVMKRACHIPVSVLAAFAGAISSFASRAESADNLILSCQYPSSAEAQAAWKPMQGSPPVEIAAVDGSVALRMPCPFAGTQIERASWDCPVTLDLSASRGVEFEFLCRDAAPVSYFSFYVQTPGGWYHASFFPESASGWNTISIDKREMVAEGRPGGWDKIHTVRVSAWRGKDKSTEFWIRNLRKTAFPAQLTSAQKTQDAIGKIGRIAGFKDFDEATRRIAELDGSKAIRAALGAAATNRESAIQLASEGKHAEALEKAEAAAARILEAFCRAQRPLKGEFRGFWCHSAFGVQGMSWDEAAGLLADNGFTAVFPNMLWGGAAYGESKVLPVARQAAERGDQIRECVGACRKHGLQVHVWKVNWYLGSAAPKDFVETLRREGRLQANLRGEEHPWLCPSHPENQRLEIQSMLEVVRNYDVDGVHFDYIRYPGVEHCYCVGCRQRFESASGSKTERWPADVLGEGPLRQVWLDWRRSNITAVVKAVSQQARAIKPKIKLSAAVFRNWTRDRDTVGQDWKVWCDHGYLDFVCPMDYTPANNKFESMITEQLEWAGKVPCYPGLGYSASSSRFGVDRAIEQILITRRLRTGGFMIFNYGAREARELVPHLGMGITRRQE